MSATEPGQSSTFLMLSRAGMGHGERALQEKLLATYLTLLLEDGALPEAIGFYTEGVRLVIEGSPVLGLLGKLESRGVALIICQTCLNHYGLAGQVRVGIVGGMGDILAAQMKADRVITL